MSEKDALIRKMEANIDKANAEVERLKAEAKESGADAEIKFERKLADLRDKRETAESKLDALRAAGDDALAEVRAEMEKVWDDFEASVRTRPSN